MKNWLRPFSLLLVVILAVLGLALAVFGEKPLPQSQMPATNQTPAQEILSLLRQVELLQNALAAETPQVAVETWARAVRMRNGAAQFALLSPKLREEQRSQYEALHWVSGVSSP